MRVVFNDSGDGERVEYGACEFVEVGPWRVSSVLESLFDVSLGVVMCFWSRHKECERHVRRFWGRVVASMLLQRGN